MIGGQNGQNGGQGGTNGNVMEALLAMLLSDKIDSELGSASALGPRHPQAERLRSELAGQLNGE